MLTRDTLIQQATLNALNDNLSIYLYSGVPEAMRKLMSLCHPDREQHWFFQEVRVHYSALVSRFQSQEPV